MIIPFNFYLITPDLKENQLISLIQIAFDAGLVAVQFRTKELHLKSMKIAEKIKNLCDQYHAYLIINQHYQLALQLDAFGFHLKSNQMLPASASSNQLIGKSIHQNQMKSTLQDAVDYWSLSPFFPPISKTNKSISLTTKEIPSLIQTLHKPIFALGGITTENVFSLQKYKIHGIAICGDYFFSTNPKQKAKQWSRIIEEFKTSMD